jgi:hypothetical protein
LLRHTALFLHRDTTTAEQHLNMLKGLAYLRFECASVQALDYGPDLLGGSGPRWAVKPWQRTPVWRAQEEGPASDHDVALHLDFDDDAGFGAYNRDLTHGEVGAYNASINVGDLTARVNYWYDGPPSISPGLVRHCALFLWAPGAAAGEKQTATDAVRALAEAPGVERVTVGHNVPLLATDYDWIMDVHLHDEQSAETLLAGDHYKEAMAAVIPATQYEWTARISHLMRGL